MPAVDQSQETTLSGDESDGQMLRQFLAAPVDDPRTLVTLAKTLLPRGQFDACAAAARHALQTCPTAAVLQILAESLWLLNAFDECDAVLEQLIGVVSDDTVEWAYRRRAKIKSRQGDHGTAQEILRDAHRRFPQNYNLLAGYTDLLAVTDAAAASAELRRAIESIANPSARSFLLKRMTLYGIAERRRQKGLSPESACSWQDVCTWRDPEGLAALTASLREEAAKPTIRIEALMDLGSCAAAGMNWEEAERYFGHVRRSQPGTFADIANFDPALYASLETKTDEMLFGDLPPVADILRRSPASDTSIFLASDPKYHAAFTGPLLRTLDLSTYRAIPHIHVHLLDGEMREWQEVATELASLKRLSVSLSAEASRAKEQGPVYARIYYHAIRFIRFYQEVKRSNRPSWILDVDVNILRDPEAGLSVLPHFDLAVSGLPQVFDPWGKLMAACVGISPTPAGLRYARLVAAYVAHTKTMGLWRWNVDQMAMFTALAHLDRAGGMPTTFFLQPDFVCLNSERTGLFQFPSGINKYLQQSAS